MYKIKTNKHLTQSYKNYLQNCYTPPLIKYFVISHITKQCIPEGIILPTVYSLQWNTYVDKHLQLRGSTTLSATPNAYSY